MPTENRIRIQRPLYPFRVLSITTGEHYYSIDEVMGEGVPARSEIEKVVRLGVDHANSVVLQFDVDDSSRKLAFLQRVANVHLALISRDASAHT